MRVTSLDQETMKVFGIGLSRTGTTSLTHALETLGFRIIHNPRDVVEIAGWFDGATDIGASCQFEMLDKLFPGSKFIYTTREMESWLDSCERHFTDTARMERLNLDYTKPEFAINAAYLSHELSIYGQVEFDREVWRSAYLRFDNRVKSYFHGRDILTMNIIGGDGWDVLLPFLGFDKGPFPRLNNGA